MCVYLVDQTIEIEDIERYLSAIDDAVMGHFVGRISRDVQPKGCDVTLLTLSPLHCESNQPVLSS